MAAPKTPFETPRACPFVALELDRDHRAEAPDYRHRCFAEPVPAPRSMAHQEAYCLSANFAACPIFQDWAVRAAAQPIDTPTPARAAGAAGAAGAGAAMAATGAAGRTSDAESTMSQLPEDASVTPAGAEIAAAAAASTGMAPPVSAQPTFATTGWEDDEPNGQLGVFDAQSAAAGSAVGAAASDWAGAANVPGYVPPPTQPSAPLPAERDVPPAAAAPAFLAGRSGRPADSPATGASAASRTARDDIVPSWEADKRYGAEVLPADDGRRGSRIDVVLTAVAVIAILALGVAAVIFLPGLLNKGSATKTPAPSSLIAASLAPTQTPTAAPSIPASVIPSVLVTPTPTVVPPTPTPVVPTATPVVPEASPLLYRIGPNDTLGRIATRFGITIQQLLAANPQITDPNHIFVGNVIVIPVVAPSP